MLMYHRAKYSCVSVYEVYLWSEVMLLELSSLSQVPGPYGVVQSTCPQFGAIMGNVYTTCPICVALELPTYRHIGIVFKCISTVYSSLSTKRHYLMWHPLVCFLPDKGLVMKIPDSNISITAAWEADLGVWANRQRIAGWGRRGELSFDTGSLRG